MPDTLAAKIDALFELVNALALDAQGAAVYDVQILRMIAETAESAQRQAVPAARAEGASWEQVARALGVTRQAAHERFAHLSTETTDTPPA